MNRTEFLINNRSKKSEQNKHSITEKYANEEKPNLIKFLQKMKDVHFCFPRKTTTQFA